MEWWSDGVLEYWVKILKGSGFSYITPLFQHSITPVFKFLGDHGEGETPVPIPNTEVKPFSADGTAWVTVWESRTLPRLKLALAKAGQIKPAIFGRLFFARGAIL